MKRFLKFFLGKKFGQKFFRLVFLFSLKGMNFGGGSDFSQSGEEWVLRNFVKPSREKKYVIFDAGANVGGYALSAHKILQQKNIDNQIYCFEPARSAFVRLKQNTANLPGIVCFNIALGKTAARMPLYSTKAESGLTSLYKRDELIVKDMDQSEEVEVDSLDSFCAKQGIANIDFLKLDIEGNEYQALLGAKKMLENKKIDFIQFEFGGTDIDARVFFRDFYKLLSPNYSIYRILKNGLQPIRTYQETDEIFITTNYLAILKSEKF